MPVDASRPAEMRTTSDLSVHDVTTGKTRQVTHDAHLWQPAVSADGNPFRALGRGGGARGGRLLRGSGGTLGPGRRPLGRGGGVP
jgi:hypothetical protein